MKARRFLPPRPDSVRKVLGLLLVAVVALPVAAGPTGPVVSSGQATLTASFETHTYGIESQGSPLLGALSGIYFGTVLEASQPGPGPSSQYVDLIRGIAIFVPAGGAPNTVPAGNVMLAPALQPGWNLLGNSLLTPIDVTATFGNPYEPRPGTTENVVSVWKWNAASYRWAFFSPQLTAAQNQAHAASSGFDVLETIHPREGFWMNVNAQFVLPPVVGAAAGFDEADFAALPPGFSLIATGNQGTPGEFTAAVTQQAPVPGLPWRGNLTSLWGWDEVNQQWYFYAPSLESSGGLAAVKAYAQSHGLLPFADHDRRLGIGMGFWVNKP